MKFLSPTALFCFFLMTSFSIHVNDTTVDLSCVKVHKATNTCHFNFKIDGVRYRFVDVGCKYSNKREEVIRKAKEGALALAREWKVECPESKSAQKEPGL